MASTPTRAVNLARQLTAIHAVSTSADGEIHNGELICTVRLQPTVASRQYTVRLQYKHERPPRVSVIDPPLELRDGVSTLPHTYSGDILCLYYPGQWNHDMLLANTVIPWTSEWLLHYELWLAMGSWLGGGDTHETGRAAPSYRPARNR